jgi:conserved oligomeric Golgi complex subunit 4
MSSLGVRQLNTKRSHESASVPKSMADCLEYDDPIEALNLLALASAELASEKSMQLQNDIKEFRFELPDILTVLHPDHPVYTVTACADTICSSLTKIASGGSQASQEIRKLEQEKREMEEHADAVETALMLRKNSDRAAQSFQARAWQDTAEAVRPWLAWKENQKPDPRVRMYAGEYSIQQLQSTYDNLKKTLLNNYENSVQKGDLQSLGQLTPILSIIQLEHEGLRLYLQFLESNLRNSLEENLNDQSPPVTKGQKPTGPTPPFILMARVFNVAVTALRHHLPMVSHCLYKAEGAASVVQLVQVQVEEAVLPVISRYQRDRQLSKVSRNAGQIYAALEDTYTGRGLVDETEDGEGDDCGFSTSIGSLSDVNAAMEETAMCIQHAESYMRFIHHTCDEVNKARQIRYDQALQLARMERERLEWTTGQRSFAVDEEDFKPMQILPASTPLGEAMAELGGQYAAIERCLLLASMQRAFSSSDTADPRYYRTISISSDNRGTIPDKALQTTLVESCLFAARRASQRAFAIGHTGTASAMTNFCVDCLRDVLLVVLTRRAEDFGVSHLKPGEGLLVGSATLFNNASNLIRQGTTVGTTVLPKDELHRRQKLEDSIAHACANINDLEVTMHHVGQLESLLNDSITRGFPPDTHDTEQLRMCVKSFGMVADGFRLAADSVVESLESVLKSRIRSIVTDTVGTEGSSSTFMGASSVMGGSKTGDRVMVRMNYNLDEESYNLLQASEGYIARLCYLLDEVLIPLQVHLAPRLWDNLLLISIGTVCKRLETSLRKCQYTSLGAIALDSDVRELLHFTKERLNAADFVSNVAVTKSCPALSRLLQIAKLLSVDDLDDVLDLISSSKRKGNWDLKLEDAKAFLCARVEFESSKVNELLRMPNH